MGLADEIKKVADKKEEIYSTLAIVTKLEATTVDVKTVKDDTEYLKVKLSPVAGDGFLIRPKLDSKVNITFLSKEKAFVTAWEEVEDIVLMGGLLDGLVTVNELVARLNNIENDNNTLKAAFNSWVTVPNDGGAALKAAAASWSGTNLVLTVKGDIENPNIKQ